MLLVNKILVRIIIIISCFVFFYNAMHIMHLRNLLYLNRYYIAQHISFRTKHMHMQTLEQFFVTHVVSRKEIKSTHSLG